MKRLKKYLRSCLAVVLVLSMVLALGIMGTPAQAAGGKKELVVYFANWDFYSANPSAQVSNLPWDRLTYINHAFWKIQKTEDGKYPIVSTDAEADLTNANNHFAQYAEYSAKYPNVNVLISVGGWNSCEYFSEMAATAEGRKSFIDSCMETMDTYTWVDGIDVDWEYPGEERDGCPASPEDDANYVLLLKEMREAFDAKYGAGAKKLTVCSSTNVEKSLSHQDLPGIAQYVDIINIMTYDMTASYDATTGHQSALYNEAGHSADKAVNYFLSKGVPASKLNIGSPLYCKGWGGVKPDENGNLVGVPGSAEGYQGDKTWNILKSMELLAAPDGELGWHKGYDESAQAAYLYNDNPSSKYYGNFLSYDSEQSVQAKTDYINEKGLAGLIVWEIGNDSVVDGCPMISVMAKGLGLYNGEIPAYTPVEIDDTISASGLPNPLRETLPGDGSNVFPNGSYIYYQNAVWQSINDASSDWPDNLPDGKWGESCWKKAFDVRPYEVGEDGVVASVGQRVFFDADNDGKGAIYEAQVTVSDTWEGNNPDGTWGTNNWKYITDLYVGDAADPDALPDPMVETIAGDGSTVFPAGTYIYYKNAIWRSINNNSNDWPDNLPDGAWGASCWKKQFDVKKYVSQEELGSWDWAADEGEYVFYDPDKDCTGGIYLATAQTSNTANDAPDGIWGTNWQYVTTLTSHIETKLQGVKDATCAEEGYTGDLVCAICGKVLKEGEVVPVTDHTWDEGKVTKEATCTAEGEMTYACTGCDKTKTEPIPAKGHTVVVDKAVEATCTKTGLTEGSHCADCLEVLKKQETIPAKGHSFKDGKCTVCGEKDPDYKPGSSSGKPNTGDNSMTLLWVILLVVCGGGAVAMSVASKKKTYR